MVSAFRPLLLMTHAAAAGDLYAQQVMQEWASRPRRYSGDITSLKDSIADAIETLPVREGEWEEDFCDEVLVVLANPYGPESPTFSADLRELAALVECADLVWKSNQIRMDAALAESLA